MKVRASVYYIPGVIFVAAIILLTHQFFLTHEFHHLPFHAAIEAMGGVAALNLFAFLFLKSRKGGRSFFLWAQCALIGMGTLDIFHSFAHPGSNFIWLRSAATFGVGLFFSFVWLPEKPLKTRTTAALLIVVLFTSISISLSAFLFPKAVPPMLVQGRFTPVAKGLNLLGGSFIWHDSIHPEDLPDVEAAIREFHMGNQRTLNIE